MANAAVKQASKVIFMWHNGLLRTLGYMLPSTATLVWGLKNLTFLPGVVKEVFVVLRKRADAL